MAPVKVGSIKEVADIAEQELLAFVAPGGHFQRDGWQTIVKAIVEEGPLMSDCGPCALLVYERYARIAVTYLGIFPDTERSMQFLKRLKNDMEEFTKNLKKIGAEFFMPHEKESCRATIEALSTMARGVCQKIQGHA
jgi:hypothetical protein